MFYSVNVKLAAHRRSVPDDCRSRTHSWAAWEGKPMVNARGIARLGTLAVGLGIGAAVAHTPVASADSSTDWLSSIDSLLSGGAFSAAAPTDLNLAISFDGYSLVSDGNAAAYTGTEGNGNYDLAIAYGDGASANAYGGTGDYALADGSAAFANAGGGTGADFDTAIDIGNNDLPDGGYYNGAYAGDADLIGNTNGGTGSYDTAIDIGNNTNDVTEGVGGNSGSFAGAGGLVGLAGDGNNDTAIDIGNNSGFGDGPAAVDGKGNYVSETGSTSGSNEGGFAAGGDNNTVIDNASYNTDGYGVGAGAGNDNYAYVDGPLNSQAGADEGDNNIAYVLDPFGSTASDATSGAGGNYDLAAVLLTEGNASATGADYVYDIITALGNETGTAASTSGGFLAELLSLF
jgi:hypothetical protein